jgi:uncharacterized membrane protein
MISVRALALPSLLLLASLAFAQADLEVADANLTYTTIDVPGAVVTGVEGINTNGDMVGYYAQGLTGSASGFLYSGGNFTLFDYPGGDSTFAREINDSGSIVGWAYTNNNTAGVGYLYDGTTFTTIKARGKSATLAEGIDNAGDVVGAYGSLGAAVGFELRGNRYKNILPPGSFS